MVDRFIKTSSSIHTKQEAGYNNVLHSGTYVFISSALLLVETRHLPFSLK
jgi:hypothetical protein